MPRNGTGTYVPPPSTWVPGVNGVTALTSDWNALLTDLVSAMSQSVSADGQTPMTGNLSMGNNKITGLAAGSANTDAINFTQQTGRLLRTTVYVRIAGVQNIIVDGAAPTTTAATTFTPLSNTVAVIIEATGAGGGSGGNPTTTGSQQAFSCGGQGGAYGVGRYTTGFSGVTVTVGAAGAAAPAGGTGGAGGASSVGALLTAPGGNGSPPGVANAGVGGTNGPAVGSLPSGANMLALLGGNPPQVLSAGIGFTSAGLGGLSGSGIPNGYGTGAGGKYNGLGTASPQPGIAATEGGLVVIREYA